MNYQGKKQKKKKRKFTKKIGLKMIMVVLLLMVAVPILVNAYMIGSTREMLIDEEEAKEMGADCILVLGAGLRPDGTPSHMLQDRLDMGIRLYMEGAAPKLLLTGDNGQEHYDEVNAMKQYAMEAGVPARDIFLDHAGFSTYESMYRARDVFDVEKAIVITQKYHQYRALYIGEGLGLEVEGVVSEPRTYGGQSYREIREFLARTKDFVKVVVKPKPTFLGNVIPISGSGLESHD